MFTWDYSYKLTRPIILGQKETKTKYIDFINWINSNYKVKVCNIRVTRIRISKRLPKETSQPRFDIKIILEYELDFNKFMKKPQIYEFDENKKKHILKKYVELVDKSKNNNLYFITFDNFESGAKYEINNSITKDEISLLISKNSKNDIWSIAKNSGSAICFMYTSKQLEALSDKRKEIITDEYFKLLKNHDIFGYYRRDSFSIYFDTKENFENNYNGNWLYYLR
jgi:hypothetical protein